MLRALDELAADADTRVIVLVSKPPARAVAERVLERAAETGKPVIACFLGADAAEVTSRGVRAASTLDEAAAMALAAARGTPYVRAERPMTSGNSEPETASTLYPRALQRRHLLLRGDAAALAGARRRALEHPGRRGRRACGRLAQPRAHTGGSRRRRVHARPSASDDRPTPAQRAPGARGGRSGGRGDPARRGARLRRPSRPRGRDGAGDPRGARRLSAGASPRSSASYAAPSAIRKGSRAKAPLCKRRARSSRRATRTPRASRPPSRRITPD